MRRLIGYITMAVAMLIAIGVAATPVLTKLSFGREFKEGHEIVFKIEANEGETLPDDASEKVAAEMRTRLDNFELEDYSVKIQGNDIVTASFSAEKTEFDYIAKYLCFSGEDFVLSGVDETTLKKDVLDYENARIEYEQKTIPVVVIPLKDGGKDKIKNIIETIGGTTTEGETTKAHVLRHEGEHEEGTEGEGTEEQKSPDIFLWANFSEEDGDSYDQVASNPLVREKILMSFYSTNIWYETEKMKDDEKETEIAFICATADTSGQLDLSGLKDDNVRANYLLNMLQATKYEYNIECPTRNVTEAGVDYYTNSIQVAASAESLITLSNNVNIALSSTLIATFVAIVIVGLLLIVYFKINALGMISTTLATIFLTIVSFRTMSVLFNVPAVIGLIILSTCVLFGEIYYASRFKEEVYKGRSIKKANQEASRKSNLITLDASIVMAFTGLMMYVLGGTALKPLGVVLFFGAIYALLMNLIVFKILMYLVTNSTNLQNKYKVFNIDGEKVPNLMANEEKPAVEGAYDKVDFTKRKRIASIIFGALSLGAVAVIAVFGGLNKSPLNVANATKDTTVIYTEITADGSLIENEETFKNYALKDLMSDENTKVEIASVEMKNVSELECHEDGNEPKEKLFFVARIDKSYSDDQLEYITNNLSEALTDGAALDSESFTIDVRNSKELVYTPNQGSVALATGIAIAGCALYIAFRFRPSRAIAFVVTTAGATLIAYGGLVATRIGTTAITSVAMPVVAVSVMLGSLFYLTIEKALRKEFNEKLTPETRNNLMIKALSKSAPLLFVFMLLVVYITINYFGFGLSQTVYLFVSALIGEIVGIVALLTIMGPLSVALENKLTKIKLPKFKFLERKEKENMNHKRNSSEPEETIFIGIND